MQQKPLSKVVLLLLVIAVGVTAFIFRPSGLYFLNDDLIHIPLSAGGVFGQRNSVRLFSDLIIYVDTLLYGKNAWGYHLSNLLFHIGTCTLLYFFIRQLQHRRNVPAGRGFAFMCAVLFFCYPFHSESIFWIIGRGSSISAFFLLLGIYLYGKKNNKITAGIFSIIAFIVALFTYESVWCFPVILFFVSRNHIKTKPGHFFQELVWGVFWFIAFAIFFIYRWAMTGSLYGSYEWDSVQGSPVSAMFANFGRLILRSLAPPMQQSNWFIGVATACLVLFTIGIFGTYKKYPQFRNWIIALLLCYAVSLIPYISLGIDTHGTESERFLYLPSIFICLLLATIVAAIRKESLQITWAFSLLSFFIICLGLSSGNYRTASKIVRDTINALQECNEKKYAVLQNLPNEHKGALMFRLGLREGWQWLKQTPLPDSIIIESYSTNDRMFQSTAIKNLHLQNDIFISQYLNNDNQQHPGNFMVSKDSAVLMTYDKEGISVFK